jgi:5-methylcytosine-specific restriction endonuclease McrA
VALHALEWIKHHGRFLRSVSAAHLRKACRRQPGECTWCGLSVRRLNKKSRRTTWCSEECVNGFLQIQPSRVRRVVYARDNGRCQQCGVGCGQMYSLLWQLRSLGPDWYATVALLTSHWVSLGFRRQSEWDDFWQADHILPVCEGGGLATPDKMQTLCIPCHSLKTRTRPRVHKERKPVCPSSPNSSSSRP